MTPYYRVALSVSKLCLYDAEFNEREPIEIKHGQEVILNIASSNGMYAWVEIRYNEKTYNGYMYLGFIEIANYKQLLDGRFNRPIF